MADVFVPELRRMAVRLDMVIVLSASKEPWQPWHRWPPWQRTICKLQAGLSRIVFESPPLRQFIFSKIRTTGSFSGQYRASGVTIKLCRSTSTAVISVVVRRGFPQSQRLANLKNASADGSVADASYLRPGH